MQRTGMRPSNCANLTPTQALHHRVSFGARKRCGRVLRCSARADAGRAALVQPGTHLDQVSVVYKFGGSSVRDADRMREVADIVCSFQEHYPAVVLSAMGKTTNNLLQAGELAMTCGYSNVAEIDPYKSIQQLHRETCATLGVDDATCQAVEDLLETLGNFLSGISIMQELTPRARDTLVSFGERLSTRIFAGYLRAQGVASQQHDAWDIGFVTNDDFTNAQIDYEESLPALRAALTRDEGAPRALPIVTGFVGRGADTGAITTLGRGGSDLTCTTLGAALGLPEVQVWKDVDGVLTGDPRIVQEAAPVPVLTYEEATELAFFGAKVLHPEAMVPAQRVQGMGVRVKNSYNREAEGTIITHARDMQGSTMTSLVLKDRVTLLDIVSTRMLGHFGFLAKVFDIFRDNKVSVDVVATSEISVSLTLDTDKIWEGALPQEELAALVEQFSAFAAVKVHREVSILTLICNVERTSHILERVFRVLGNNEINVYMMSQGASKTNISLVVDESIARYAIQLLHDEFFFSDAHSRSVKVPNVDSLPRKLPGSEISV